ncbi:helix-hairpin-helix domain-containing protein [Haloplanus halobius]|uniref:helix-hairpin-helix domain-containing protein n=1 Tax=Haloplanus halobius TaxID=2934938 RepID=UPI00200EE249|nr:helix-hairpin-helix domain-containing protein [Haloplanus sp. XH21]
MGLLDTLRSVLGLGESSENRERERETTVSVEHEPQTETEDAVKGTEADESVAAETEAAASTESLVEEEGPTDAAEPAEAASPDAGDVETELDTADAESEGETTGEHEAQDLEGSQPESVDVIKGVGPAYARRLSEAGVDTVAELAAADAEELAADIDLSPKRVGRWIDRAKDH